MDVLRSTLAKGSLWRVKNFAIVTINVYRSSPFFDSDRFRLPCI
jgi:hypothetical protein